jgi:hypothetical protein
MKKAAYLQKYGYLYTYLTEKIRYTGQVVTYEYHDNIELISHNAQKFDTSALTVINEVSAQKRFATQHADASHLPWLTNEYVLMADDDFRWAPGRAGNPAMIFDILGRKIERSTSFRSNRMRSGKSLLPGVYLVKFSQ